MGSKYRQYSRFDSKHDSEGLCNHLKMILYIYLFITYILNNGCISTLILRLKMVIFVNCSLLIG